MFGVSSRADGANTTESPDSGIKATARIRVLGIELRDNSDRRCNDADLAKSRRRRAIATIDVDVGHGRELPNIRTLAAVHFERACGRPELYDESIDVFPDELITEPSDHLLARRGATHQRTA